MKKQLLSLSLVLLSLTFIAQDLSNGLLLHYDFNGNANDISGNAMHATVNGATLTTDKDGNMNSAYYFDGVDDYMELPNDVSLKPQLPITISCYVKLENNNDLTTSTGIVNTDHINDKYTGIWLAYSSNNKSFSVAYGDGGTVGSSSRRSGYGSTEINVGEWNHVVAIVRGPTDMQLYINCNKEEMTYSGSGGSLGYSSNSGVLGMADGHVSYSPYHFQGGLDDLHYWDRALTEEEVNMLCTGCSMSLTYETTNSINGNGGSIDITVIGGDGSYTFDWDNGEETEDISNLANGTYTVIVTDGNGCESEETIVVSNTLIGIDEYISGNLIEKVYPNPSSGEVTVVLNGDKSLNVKVIDLNGKVLREYKNCHKNELKIKELPSGVYLLKVFNHNLESTQKLIILN